MTIKEYVKAQKDSLKETIEKLDVLPKLVIIQVNQDEASNAYVKGKIKDLTYIGARFEHILLPIETTEEELFKVIDKYNNDDDTDAILVQMPLPKQINEDKVKAYINPSKDVDGFHPMSKYAPCTPYGMVTYLTDMGFEFRGKNAVIIGRSNIVGKPCYKLLLAKDMNVTILHSKTTKEDMAFYLKHADLVVVAVGKKAFLSDQELKKSCVVMDVGINRVDGILYGDCKPGLDVAFQSPVPGGVGLLTRVALLKNLMLCYQDGRKK